MALRRSGGSNPLGSTPVWSLFRPLPLRPSLLRSLGFAAAPPGGGHVPFGHNDPQNLAALNREKNRVRGEFIKPDFGNEFLTVARLLPVKSPNRVDFDALPRGWRAWPRCPNQFFS
jgi:hypothetical protein